jgi:hypothetical protein
MEPTSSENDELLNVISSHHDFETMFMRRDTFQAELIDLGASPSKSVTEDEQWFQSVNVLESLAGDDPNEAPDILTEEDILNAALNADPDQHLTEEERMVRLQNEYWERRAETIMAEADKHSKNRLLSVIEIRTWLDSGHLSDDDKWFCEWLLSARCLHVIFCQHDLFYSYTHLSKFVLCRFTKEA